MGNKKEHLVFVPVAFAVVARLHLVFPVAAIFCIAKLGWGCVSIRVGHRPGHRLTTVLFSPIMGALTDRWGRRPVILLGMAGMAVWFGLFALG